MKINSEAKAHGGSQGVYTTPSEACGCDMTFAVFAPPQARSIFARWSGTLSGLTCTHANVMDKGEYRRLAAELGLIVVCPDVSPRGDHVPDEPDNWQFGKGAGFYLDATEAPYAAHYKMETHILSEFPALIASHFAADMGARASWAIPWAGTGR
jgi:S-formylglutathione hydrolase